MLTKLRARLPERRMALKIVVGSSLTIGVGVGMYQGYVLRDKYRVGEKLEPPKGPQFGLEKWVDEKIEKIRQLKEKKLADLEEKYGDLLEEKLEKTKENVEKTKAKVREMWHKVVKRLDLDDEEKKKRRQLQHHKSAQETADSDLQMWRDLKRIIWTEGTDIASSSSSSEGGDASSSPSSSSSSSSSSPSSVSNRRIKLLVLGDSLVAGVGCDNIDSSPVLPQIVAKMLNSTLKIDVEWHSAGIVGGTVQELRALLPSIKRDFLDRSLLPRSTPSSPTTSSASSSSSSSSGSTSSSGSSVIRRAMTKGGEVTPPSPLLTNEQQQHNNNNNNIKLDEDDEEELIVVIICGLNDFKTFFERFTYGPYTFRKELKALVSELQHLGARRVFLPALPEILLDSDPNFSLRIAPLRWIALLVCWTWDLQKRNIAQELSEQQQQQQQQQLLTSSSGTLVAPPPPSTSTSSPSTAILQHQQQHTTFIPSPTLQSTYATPGAGNVSSDGVHLSTKGYTWWGRHISEQILLALQEEDQGEKEGEGKAKGKRMNE